MEFDEWYRMVGDEYAKCGCNHPGAHPPCSWCTDGIYVEYENWCEENNRIPLYNNEPQKDTSMRLNRKNFAEFFRTDYYLVGVKFLDNSGVAMTPQAQQERKKMYTYKVPKGVELSIGDKVVVCTQDPDFADDLRITVVAKVDTDLEVLQDGSIDYKWIVAPYDDLIASYKQNIEKDNKLKQGVAKLEQALERVNLQTQLKLAMEMLDDGTKKELSEIFGMGNLLGNDNGTKENSST